MLLNSLLNADLKGAELFSSDGLSETVNKALLATVDSVQSSFLYLNLVGYLSGTLSFDNNQNDQEEEEKVELDPSDMIVHDETYRCYNIVFQLKEGDKLVDITLRIPNPNYQEEDINNNKKLDLVTQLAILFKSTFETTYAQLLSEQQVVEQPEEQEVQEESKEMEV